MKNILQSDDWLKNPDSLQIERVQNSGYRSTTIIDSLPEMERREYIDKIRQKDEEIRKLKQELEHASKASPMSKVEINLNYNSGDTVQNKTIIPNVSNYRPEIQTQTMNMPLPPMEQDEQELLEDE